MVWEEDTKDNEDIKSATAVFHCFTTSITKGSLAPFLASNQSLIFYMVLSSHHGVPRLNLSKQSAKHTKQGPDQSVTDRLHNSTIKGKGLQAGFKCNYSNYKSTANYTIAKRCNHGTNFSTQARNRREDERTASGGCFSVREISTFSFRSAMSAADEIKQFTAKWPQDESSIQEQNL